MRALLAWTLLACAAAALASEDYPFRLVGKREADGASVYAINDGPIPISVTVRFTELVNLKSEAPSPVALVVPPHSGERRIAGLHPVDAHESWNYRYNYQYRYGAYTAVHGRDAVYRLPWQEGRTFLISQA